jgi:hypothetical protein
MQASSVVWGERVARLDAVESRYAPLSALFLALTALLLSMWPANAALSIIPCAGCQLDRLAAGGRQDHPRQGRARERRMRLAYDPFLHSGQWTPAGLTSRSATRIFGAGDSPLTFEATRRIARRTAGPEPVGTYGDRVSMGFATLRYKALTAGDDALSFGLTAGMEKRRFAFDLADGHRARNESAGFDIAWSHGPGWRLRAGYRVDFGSRPSTVVERGIELAEGAALSQRGAWTAASYDVGRQGHASGLSLDLRAQRFRLTERDRLALGTPGRTDNRLSLGLSIKFHE